MLQLKKSRLSDVNFWFLIGINVFSIVYYQRNPTQFNSVLWLYWFQSVLIGIFTFLDMITLKPAPAGIDKTNGPFQSKGCSAFFFLFHYQTFHLAYFLFILLSGKIIDRLFLLIGVTSLLVNMVIEFIQRKNKELKSGVNFTRIFFLPYLRIIPMHVMILAPLFLKIKPTLVFLILKSIADITMYTILKKESPAKRSAP